MTTFWKMPRHALCESCGRHPAAMEVLFDDGATFLVCHGCRPGSGAGVVTLLPMAEVAGL